MAPKTISQYTLPHQFEPLLPQFRTEELRSRARTVIQRSLRLSGAAHPATASRLRELVRAMNSYYSNRLEGQSTHPLNIERALRQDFSTRPDVAKLQRLALAHIEAERELERSVAAGQAPLSQDFLRRAHAALYGRLSVDDRTMREGRVVEPGAWRREQVAVGRHEPPLWSSLEGFLGRLDQAYGGVPSMEDYLIQVAAAHHRVAWVHPFLDGNGRAIRLQTHCALLPFSAGLWSVNRGLARQREKYFALLEAADEHRLNDLDGRGNLSEKLLWQWCDWLIALAEDQVDFMSVMLDLDSMRARIDALVTYRSKLDRRVRAEAVAPLHHLFVAGPTSRGEFQRMTGLGERTARALLAHLLDSGLVVSASHVAPVEIAFPLDALQFLLPQLYPEAAAPP